MSDSARMPVASRPSARTCDNASAFDRDVFPMNPTQETLRAPFDYRGYTHGGTGHAMSGLSTAHGHSYIHDVYRHGPSAPISEAFPPPPGLTRNTGISIAREANTTSHRGDAPTPGPSSAPHVASPIDPALVALPPGPDFDLARAKPAKKVGSVRKQRGRPAGSGNYAIEDVNMLLNFVHEELPLGQRGWKITTKRYNKWAKQAKRPLRTPKSLETKYKQLLRQKKPTGSGYRPPEIERAYEIEEEINERAGNRRVNDSEHAAEEDDSDVHSQANKDELGDSSNESSSASEEDEQQDLDDDDAPLAVKPTKKPAGGATASSKATRVAKAVRAPSPEGPGNRRVGRAAGGAADLVSNLSQAFNPEAMRMRDIERGERLTSTTQVLTMASQVRDLQQEIFRMQDRVHEAERARDRAEMRLEWANGANARSHTYNPAFDVSPARNTNMNPSRLGRRKRFIRHEEKYPREEGGFTYFETDGSETDSEFMRDVDRYRKRYHAGSRGNRRNPRLAPREHSPHHARSPYPASTSRNRAVSHSTSSRVAAAGPSRNGVEVSVTPGRTPRISFLVNPSPSASISRPEEPVTEGIEGANEEDGMHVDA